MNIILTDLGFGDGGKGKITDFLTNQFSANNFRFCGGSQCGHNVVSNRTHHTFSQFGSGTLSGAKTVLTKFVLVDPLALMVESEQLQKNGIKYPLQNLFISQDCSIITPFQQISGQIKELSRVNKHGSCGKGVGETVFDSKTYPYAVIKIKDLLSKDLVYRLNLLKAIKLDQIQQQNNFPKLMAKFENYSVSVLAKIYNQIANSLNIVSDLKISEIIDSADSVWEGSQGILIDCNYGFKPYITKTNVTAFNAQEVLQHRLNLKIGIIRSYGVRHGNGPFPTEDQNLLFKEDHNNDNEWQGKYRNGWLDLVLTKYSIAVNQGVDQLALTCLDKLSGLDEIKVCIGYKFFGDHYTAQNYFIFDSNNQIIGVKPQIQNEVITKLLEQCHPIYTSFSGWPEKISDFKKLEQLPKTARIFLDFIEEQLAVPLKLISVGPERNQIILKP